MSPDITFNVELAGIPIRVQCRYKENRAFFSDYMTERTPVLTVAPTEQDCRRIRRDLTAMLQRTMADTAPQSGSTPRQHGETEEPYAGHYLENNAIHQLIAEELAAYDVLLFHGSALCMDSRAVIFTAPSGVGKSTQARLWREAFGDRVWMINDDKPLLRRTADKIMVYGSPWDGKHHLSRNAAAPLQTVFHIQRSSQNHLESLSQADAFQLLLKQCYLPQTAADRARYLTLMKQMTEQVRFYTLYCNQTLEAVYTALEGVTAS